MKQQPGSSGFPRKTALCVATAVFLLAAWHWSTGGGRSARYPPGLDGRTLFSTTALPWIHSAPRSILQSSTQPAAPTSTYAATTAPTTQPANALLLDNAGSLDRFYASLARLDAHAAHASATVVHFGDSPTTADLITGDVRQQLQQRFGDAGPGFNLIAKPWAWYQHRDIDELDSGWKFTTAVGLMREGQIGIGGVAFDGGSGANVRYKLSGTSPDTMQMIWKSQPGGGSVAVLANEQQIATIGTSAPASNAQPNGGLGITSQRDGPVSPPQFQTIPLPAGTHSIALRVIDAPVHLYGVVFERRGPGLRYDSMGLNGASITVLSRALGEDMMKQSFQHLHPDLIVMNYGTNEASFASFVDKQYEGELRVAIARVHEAAPNASLLLMGPMDRGERGAGNAIATMNTIPKIVAIQQRVATDTGCAFFDTYEAMGGEGTMQRWYQGRPRLVGGDLIHPTPQGARIIADMFVQQIEAGYARFQSRIGLASTPNRTAHVSGKSSGGETISR